LLSKQMHPTPAPAMNRTGLYPPFSVFPQEKRNPYDNAITAAIAAKTGKGDSVQHHERIQTAFVRPSLVSCQSILLYLPEQCRVGNAQAFGCLTDCFALAERPQKERSLVSFDMVFQSLSGRTNARGRGKGVRADHVLSDSV
jgi:hypothetical protein